MNPDTQGLSYVSGSLPYFQSIERYLYIVVDAFIAIGILNSLFNKKINPIKVILKRCQLQVSLF